MNFNYFTDYFNYFHDNFKLISRGKFWTTLGKRFPAGHVSPGTCSKVLIFLQMKCNLNQIMLLGKWLICKDDQQMLSKKSRTQQKKQQMNMITILITYTFYQSSKKHNCTSLKQKENKRKEWIKALVRLKITDATLFH